MVPEPNGDQRQLDRLKSIEWSRQLLEKPGDWCIIDTETTGLQPKSSRVVEISVINGSGDIVFDSLINPGVPIPQEVARIHGISDDLVVDAPSISDSWLRLQEVTQDKLILAYNSSFDRGMLFYEAIRNGLPKLKSEWDCVMVKYSAFIGIWNPRFGNYQYQKLPSAGHRSNIDCKVTLDLVHLMGDSKS